VIARRAVEIGNNENMDIEQNAAEALAESCGNDIRQVLNALQMWATKGKAKGNDGKRVTLRYMEFKVRRSGPIRINSVEGIFLSKRDWFVVVGLLK
jgi:replication factor C subunit 1